MAAGYREVSFHGLVGSTHTYGCLAKGNIASEENHKCLDELTRILDWLDLLFPEKDAAAVVIKEFDEKPGR